MKKSARITLAQLFSWSLILLIALLSLLFYLLFQTSQASIMQASDNLRREASRALSEKVSSYLDQAEETEESFQAAVATQVFDPKDQTALETLLFSLLLMNGNLSEISLTYGEKTGYDAEGNILLASMGRGEMILYRTKGENGPIDTRFTYQKNGVWTVDTRLRSAKNDLFGAPMTQETAGGAVTDPTAHPTFATPANARYGGKALWSDLHWSQIDENFPENERRVEVSLQKAVTDAKGAFLGVLRVGLFGKQIEPISNFKLIPNDPKDPHIVFIADRSGELITRPNATDLLRPADGDLRFSPANAPPEVRLSLKTKALQSVSADAPLQSGQFDYQGATYLVTFREIEGSQGWILGIVVPQKYYVGSLLALRNRLLLAAGLIMGALCVGGVFIARALKRGQAKVLAETVKMHQFDFTPVPPRSLFRDVYEILASLELAKTAMRAMGKFVPVQLVRQLYQSEKEPELGGSVQDVSILFTDIRNFTASSEKLPVNKLAAALGEYLKAMTQIIQNEHQGTIDKYIGDGIMALWNAPTPVPNHAGKACQAVLDCRAALQKLFASPSWQNLPRFETRFGLHKDRVMVGNFGAPDRLNYTAIGNGVNIASRLESLNKQYGTTMIVSEKIYEDAKELFTFRLLDLVAVRGESEGIDVYELIGKKGERPEMTDTIAKYEKALASYRGRRFQEAVDLLKDQLNDPPSRTLHDRAIAFLQNPPPPGWNGLYSQTY
jgi:adenylate cyclase